MRELNTFPSTPVEKPRTLNLRVCDIAFGLSVAFVKGSMIDHKRRVPESGFDGDSWRSRNPVIYKRIFVSVNAPFFVLLTRHNPEELNHCIGSCPWVQVLPMEKKQLRMDFKVEWEIIDEKRHVFKARMVPDPDRYERRTINGKEGYFDKQDKVFFSDEVLASAARTLAGKPIYLPPTTPDLKQYFDDAKKRIEQSLESEIQLDRELDRGSAYLNVNAGRELLFVVLYIDIVGSTELSRVLSPVAQRTLIPTFLREMTLLVDAYGGYAHKYTGDGLIAFFPTDPSWTGATDLAIDCAVAMRLLLVHVLNPLLKSKSYPTLQFRIGVDSGETQIVDLGAKNVKSTPDLLGYTMNIAAKICAACPPDKIAIGESVFRNLHVSRKKNFEELNLPRERWNYLDASTNRRYSVFVLAESS